MLVIRSVFFFFNDTATTEIYTLSLHDALPIYTPVAGSSHDSIWWESASPVERSRNRRHTPNVDAPGEPRAYPVGRGHRSEEHTSELQSRQYLVCRLLLEKKKKIQQ